MTHTITITIRSGKRYVVSTTTQGCTGIVTGDWRVVVQTVTGLVGALVDNGDGEDIRIEYK